MIQEVEKQNEEKTNYFDRPRIEPVSGQNKFKSGPFSTLSPCANEAVVRNHCIIVTSWLSETKGFVFHSIKGPQRMPLEKCVFFHIHNISKRKRTSEKKHAEHCLRHVNKTTCKIWSISDKVHF